MVYKNHPCVDLDSTVPSVTRAEQSDGTLCLLFVLLAPLAPAGTKLHPRGVRRGEFLFGRAKQIKWPRKWRVSAGHWLEAHCNEQETQACSRMNSNGCSLYLYKKTPQINYHFTGWWIVCEFLKILTCYRLEQGNILMLSSREFQVFK